MFYQVGAWLPILKLTRIGGYCFNLEIYMQRDTIFLMILFLICMVVNVLVIYVHADFFS